MNLTPSATQQPRSVKSSYSRVFSRSSEQCGSVCVPIADGTPPVTAARVRHRPPHRPSAGDSRLRSSSHHLSEHQRRSWTSTSFLLAEHARRPAIFSSRSQTPHRYDRIPLAACCTCAVTRRSCRPTKAQIHR
ncbi:hypothetical protein QQF64_015804 [Cirrhinus molitorella]|uniref:Uncharacterized protein n=1 Tax=Cirrhinus molitorella TaxID=172907 RepID=A0ABR3LMF0_9TELE